MTFILAVALAASTTALSLLVSGQECGGPNLIQNGNFEEGTLQGAWRPGPHFDSDITYIQNNVFLDGNSALVIDFGSKPDAMSDLYHGPLFLRQDKKYIFKGSIYKDADTTAAVHLKGNDGNIHSFTFEAGDTQSKWQTFEFGWDNQKLAMSVVVEAFGGNSPVYFDGFELVTCDLTGTLKKRGLEESCGFNLLSNSAFNDPQHNTWTGNFWQLTDCPVSYGSQARISCVALTTATSSLAQTFSIAKNHVYRVTGRLYSLPDTGVQIVVSTEGGDIPIGSFSSTNSREGYEWSNIAETFESKNAETATLTFTRFGDARVFLSNLSITRVDCDSAEIGRFKRDEL